VYEPRPVGPSYRIAWISVQNIIHQSGCVTYGPLVPASRFDTFRPAGFHATVGGSDYLYLVAATPNPNTTPRPLPRTPTRDYVLCLPVQADAAALGDAAAPEAGGAPTFTPPAETPHSPLQLYRVRWEATDYDSFEMVRTYARPLGDFPVSAAEALPMGDGHSFGLAWVEFNPPDSVGHGVQYALYFARLEF
jgi:hypothetical protein